MQTSVHHLTLLAAGAFITAAVGGLLLFRAKRRRADPEQRRRALIVERGRVIEGVVLDFSPAVVVYSWSWRGVDYEASQDLRALSHVLPDPADALTGPVSVRFLPRDPSNSIVLSENWSGFQRRKLTAREV